MKALIFGITGQDGYYLSNLLSKQRIEVIGVSRSNRKISGDVSNFNFVESLIKESQPNYIFHFAADSTTCHSALFDNHNAISIGSLNILESANLHCPSAKIFLSGSALQFKNEGLPIDEETPFESSSPYSLARIHSVYAGRYYRKAFGLKVYVGYFFNHDSPLRTERHINQKIVSTVKRIAKGSFEKLELGDIEVRKEFNFAGDIVNAIWMLINQDAVLEAVIGSGKSYSIKEWTDYCFSKINRNLEDYIILKPNFITEYKVLVSNPFLIKKIGWESHKDIFQLADMMLSFT